MARNPMSIVLFGIAGLVALLIVFWIASPSPTAAPVVECPACNTTAPASQTENVDTEAAVVPLSTATGCPAGYAPTSADIECDVLLTGYGPANAFNAYLLAPLLGSKLCIVDDRASVGGKVKAVEAPQSTPQQRLYSPTHAEQLLSDHVHMRCLAQAMGEPVDYRSSWFRRPKHWEFISATGYNVTSVCPECWTWSVEKLLAPNGISSSKARYASHADGEKNGIPDLCNGNDYTACSIGDETWLRLIDGTNSSELQAKDFAIFADYARHRLQSPEAAKEYFGLSSGIGYIVTPRDTPTGAVAGFEYADNEWNGPASGFYWPLNGPNMIWRKVDANVTLAGARVFYNERATCFDKATDSKSGTYPYVVRTVNRNIRAKRVVFGMPPGQFVDTISGTLGNALANRKEMQAMSTPFPQCSIELFFPNKWWFETRSQPTDGFYLNADGDFGILDTAAIRNITEWTFYDAQNGNWFRYMPHRNIRKMNLIRFLPDICQEWNEVYLNGGNAAVEARAIRIMKSLFEPALNVSKPLKSHYTYEKYGFGHFNGRTNVSTQDVLDFAKIPLPGEKVCFSGEGFQWPRAGWQEGATDGAVACFGSGSALSGYYAPGQLSNKIDRCSNSAGQKLDAKTSSISDRCLFLDNEQSMMASAGIDYCAPSSKKKRAVAQSDNAPVRTDRLGPH